MTYDEETDIVTVSSVNFDVEMLISVEDYTQWDGAFPPAPAKSNWKRDGF
ncbi:hypothetical protein FRUB_00301 [Fimbriiglobus ruber]|uniref:Uncharacterized protein n=2 Tax=Fimbriiglobus ruber TaxID=1908690 RepID=A0A225DZ67_9BACT|nr:hypothetical protein FRUB_00301 [Fimbriiglobus ruber]